MFYDLSVEEIENLGKDRLLFYHKFALHIIRTSINVSFWMHVWHLHICLFGNTGEGEGASWNLADAYRMAALQLYQDTMPLMSD